MFSRNADIESVSDLIHQQQGGDRQQIKAQVAYLLDILIRLGEYDLYERLVHSLLVQYSLAGKEALVELGNYLERNGSLEQIPEPIRGIVTDSYIQRLKQGKPPKFSVLNLGALWS